MASDSRRSCGSSSSREHISARRMLLLASDSRRSCGCSLGMDHIWLLQKGVCGVGGGVLLASDSRRSCVYSLSREHISARGMMLLASGSRPSCVYSLGNDHIWLLQRGCAEWVGGVFLASDSRRSYGHTLCREHISARGVLFLASESRRSCGCALGKDHIWLLQRRCAEWVGGVLLASDSRRSCGLSLGREHIWLLHWAARSGLAACSWRRIRGVVVGIP